MARIPNSYGMNRSQPWNMAGSVNPAIVRFFNAVYAWMCVGLAVTAGLAWFVAQSPELASSFYRARWILLIVQLFLVFKVVNSIDRMSTGVATLLFVVYAAINGLVLSSLLFFYDRSAIASAFTITAGTFGAMSIFGMVTKRDLSFMGRIMFMLLIGLVIASVVSYFWHNSALQVIINYVGVLVFVGLTAYDTQKLKAIAEQTQGDAARAARMSIVGSLVLYLDFINLFLFILQLMNSDRRR